MKSSTGIVAESHSLTSDICVIDALVLTTLGNALVLYLRSNRHVLVDFQSPSCELGWKVNMNWGINIRSIERHCRIFMK